MADHQPQYLREFPVPAVYGLRRPMRENIGLDHSPNQAPMVGLSCMVSKTSECTGLLPYFLGRSVGQNSKLKPL